MSDVDTGIIFNENAKLNGLPPFYYRKRSNYNHYNNKLLFSHHNCIKQQQSSQQPSLSSNYTHLLGALTSSNPWYTSICLHPKKFTPWIQMSDQIIPKNGGVDTKYNSYQRYMYRRQGFNLRNIL